MTQGEQLATIVAGVRTLESGQQDLKLQFTNHLIHHREDRIKTEDRFRRWVWISVPTIATLFIALVSAAYFLAKNSS